MLPVCSPDRRTHALRNTALAIAALLTVVSCRPMKVVQIEHERIDTAVPPYVDSTVLGIVEPYRTELEASMEVEVARLSGDLVKEQPEGSLGNHMAAVTYEVAQQFSDKTVDFAVMNYGGIRVPYIAAGPLRVRDAYQVMPFDNYIVYLNINGADVRRLADRMAIAGGWPVEQMTYVTGKEGATKVTIGGQPLDEGAEYRMAITDYLADGGDHLDFLKKYTYFNTGVLLRDALIDYWKAAESEGRILQPVKDGRVR